MKLKLLILCFFISLNFYSQTLIKGSIQDTLGTKIKSANIQILDFDTKRVLKFTQSNEFGKFEIQLASLESSKIFLKISHLGFINENLLIDIINEKEINKIIVLKRKQFVLQEVKIKGDFRDVTEKNDTIKYNLKKLLNGSEENLKEMIKKLPGLKIDSNGKILFNGVQIDNLLIEGDDLYDKQHQLATENLKSEMIEKIEVLKNYISFSTLKDFITQKKTAVSISLKDGFKNKIKSDADFAYGYKIRYKFHNYLYNFSTKTKFSLITEVNNVNDVVFTVTDYLDLKKTTTQKNDDGATNSLEIQDNLPNFLFSQDDINKKAIQNLTFNINHTLSKRIKIHGYSISNFFNTDESQVTKQTFYDQNPFPLLKNTTINGSSKFNSNYILFENKKNENTFFNYLISSNYSEDIQYKYFNTNQIQNNSLNFFNENSNLSNLILAQSALFKKSFNSKKLFEISFFNDYSKINRLIDLNSNNAFLNLNFQNNFFNNQSFKQELFRFGFNSKFILKSKIGTFSFKAGSLLNNESFSSNIDFSNPTFSSASKAFRINDFIGFNFKNKKQEIFNYSLGLITNYDKLNLNGSNEYLNFLPNINLSYTPNKKINLGISFKQEINYPNIKQAINNYLISDFRTINRGDEIFYKNVLLNNIYTFNFVYNDFKKDVNGFISITYSSKNKDIGTNIINSNITEIENRYVNINNNSNLFFMLTKKFQFIPWSVKIESLQSIMNKEAFSNSTQNTIKSIQSKYEIEFMSYFKNNNFNINFGTEYLFTRSKNSLNNNETFFNKFSPFININGLILKDKLFWEIKNNFIKLSSTDLNQDAIIDIQPRISYKFNNWKFSIMGRNILNIKDDNFKIKTNFNTIYIEETKYKSLPGYINFGFSYYF